MVRTVLVVMLYVDAQDLLQMPTPDDQQPVQALGADRTDPAFRECVRLERPHRRAQHLDAFSGEDAVEAAAELRVAVA